MYICIKHDIKRELSIVGNILTHDIGYVKNKYEKYDCIDEDEVIYELSDDLSEELMKDGVIYEE